MKIKPFVWFCVCVLFVAGMLVGCGNQVQPSPSPVVSPTVKPTAIADLRHNDTGSKLYYGEWEIEQVMYLDKTKAGNEKTGDKHRALYGKRFSLDENLAKFDGKRIEKPVYRENVLYNEAAYTHNIPADSLGIKGSYYLYVQTRTQDFEPTQGIGSGFYVVDDNTLVVYDNVTCALYKARRADSD